MLDSNSLNLGSLTNTKVFSTQENSKSEHTSLMPYVNHLQMNVEAPFTTSTLIAA